MGLQEWKQLEPGDWGRGGSCWGLPAELWGAHRRCAVVTSDNPHVFLLPVPTGTLREAFLVWELEQQHCGAGWGRGEWSPALLEAKAELMSWCCNPGTSTWCCWLLPCTSGAVAATSFNRSQVDDLVPPCPGMSLAGRLMDPHHPAESGASEQNLAPPDTPEGPILRAHAPCAARDPPCLPQSLTL